MIMPVRPNSVVKGWDSRVQALTTTSITTKRNYLT